MASLALLCPPPRGFPRTTLLCTAAPAALGLRILANRTRGPSHPPWACPDLSPASSLSLSEPPCFPPPRLHPLSSDGVGSPQTPGTPERLAEGKRA